MDQQKYSTQNYSYNCMNFCTWSRVYFNYLESFHAEYESNDAKQESKERDKTKDT